MISDSNLFVEGPDGMPVAGVNIDDLTARALRVAGELAIASADPMAVHRILSEQVNAKDLPVWLRAAFAVIVIQELTVELFGPMLMALRVEHLDTDFIAQLQSRSGIEAATSADKTGEMSPESEA